ncbi:hypothetical protein TBLA_0F02260 [Henningerozyma blattae CBS 6284]|uniref:Nop14-like family protein n=1 Tax=Henningerozyma blattae (strain ATCC 34711 / CBS 6284 / DSM 70876 / NBRC 10599 / NRRL Y-10934 / UCD 77-7) TaxID=1071380 RepID=I2H5W6_HENB6|nr:hypothetical protein TBLA_0F02260 [Tetrapisispora blattae CBS 6284]CCH61768.1 hypothetical protein TBLA_0F02260 [Tetrapisispora blattae CBS 6284]
MAGSQLKNLKATLKAHGLTGQTKSKKKNTKRQPKDFDREEKAKIIAKIREDFNPFEVKATRNKRKDNKIGNDKIAVGKPGISKQIGEEKRLHAFESRKKLKVRKVVLLISVYGERDKNMTEEEKMLERFTRERQSQSRKNKKDLFNLEGDTNEFDDGDMFGNGLTHLGKTISMDDDFDQGDLGLKRAYGDEDGTQEPFRKKTKAEIMREVIAKSKYYKHERQKEHAKMEDEVDALDEDFEDIMSELASSNMTSKATIQEKPEVDKDYDVKVKELLMEKRAVPADRTKTDEELKNEAEEKKKQLEQQRLDRMKGMLEDDDGKEKGVEDLDDGFWENDDDDDMAGEIIANSDDDVQLENDDEQEPLTHAENQLSNFPRQLPNAPCPSNVQELVSFLEKSPLNEHPKMVRAIIRAYQPKLAEGNNEKMSTFTGVLLRYILFISNQDPSQNVMDLQTAQNSLIRILKSLAEKYNRGLSDTSRLIISEIQERFTLGKFSNLTIGDLVFFSIMGTIFSTSDQYHIVITPCSILIGEFLEQIKLDSLPALAYGSILVKITLQYERLSKRFIPEVAYFLEKSLTSLLDRKFSNLDGIRLDSHALGLTKFSNFDENDTPILYLHQIFDNNNNSTDTFKKSIIKNCLESLEHIISSVWKELPAFKELIKPFELLLRQYSTAYPSLSNSEHIIDKIERLLKFDEHTPLTLQNHKPIAIPSRAPKFEENFNPDKKSYDPDRTRSELNKLKAQIKKERKFTMKEIRKDTRFEARQNISLKKKENEEYHAKMSRIVNSINTEEGAEKNKYEREKRLRNTKK